MTPEQLATLKTYIDAQPDLSVIPNTPDGAFEAAAGDGGQPCDRF